MAEVINCGGGHRTRLRDCLLSFGVPPGHVYKGGRGGGRQPRGARHRGSPTRIPNPSWTPLPFPRGGEREGGGEGEGKRGRRPLPSPIRTCHGGGGHPCGPPLLSNKAHEGPLLPRYSRNSLVLR